MAASEFDELDQAVASVLGTPPAAQPPVPAETPKETTPEPAPVRAPEPTVEKPAPVVAPRPRSTGRFMDMVHASSDMRPTQAAPHAPAQSAVLADRPKQPTYNQPDPLDFHGFNDIIPPKPKEKPAEPPVVAAPVAPEPTPAPNPEVTAPDPAVVEEPAGEPLTTPFLANAKVEKRPLGAFSDPVKPESEATAEPTPLPEMPTLPIESVDETPSTEVKPAEEEKPTPLPAELDTDLLSIESTERPESEPAMPEAPSPTPDDVPVMPSIVQQYTEKPSSDTKPSAGIYDTEAVHLPLTHAPKKRNGWLIVVWIAALVLVGAGIGLLLHFVVLPMLG